MTTQTVGAAVALVSAIASVAFAILGTRERKRAFDAQKAEFREQADERKRAFAAQNADLQRQADQWRNQMAAERNSQEVLLRKEFMLEQYRHRLSSYRNVFPTLGTVSDVSFDPAPQRYEALRKDEHLLRSAADNIYAHLYGEPGLLMTMETRNRLHAARLQCVTFLQSDGSPRAGQKLADAFFYARRYLRADLELLDDRTAQNLELLVQKLGYEPGAK